MADGVGVSDMPANSTLQPLRGLLITADPALARAFRRELRQCADCRISFDVQHDFAEAQRGGGARYDCITVDLDGSIAPSEAVRIARLGWPDARVALLACWWSDRDRLANQADVVIHKPLRSSELRAFLRSPTGAPQIDEQAIETPAAATG